MKPAMATGPAGICGPGGATRSELFSAVATIWAPRQVSTAGPAAPNTGSRGHVSGNISSRTTSPSGVVVSVPVELPCSSSGSGARLHGQLGLHVARSVPGDQVGGGLAVDLDPKAVPDPS